MAKKEITTDDKVLLTTTEPAQVTTAKEVQPVEATTRSSLRQFAGWYKFPLLLLALALLFIVLLVVAYKLGQRSVRGDLNEGNLCNYRQMYDRGYGPEMMGPGANYRNSSGSTTPSLQTN